MPELQPCVGASGGIHFPWPTPEERKKKVAESFRVKVKGGNYGYNKGVYGQFDYVKDYDTLGEALADFLGWINDAEDDKVTLQFRHAKDEEWASRG